MSPEGRPARCGGWAMNATPDIDHTALAELMSRRWQKERAYFTLNREARGAWAEGSWWWREPGDTALKLHWSRRSPALKMQTVFARAVVPKEAE